MAQAVPAIDSVVSLVTSLGLVPYTLLCPRLEEAYALHLQRSPR
jgi:hypothetical protein